MPSSRHSSMARTRVIIKLSPAIIAIILVMFRPNPLKLTVHMTIPASIQVSAMGPVVVAVLVTADSKPFTDKALRLKSTITKKALQVAQKTDLWGENPANTIMKIVAMGIIWYQPFFSVFFSESTSDISIF